MRRPGNKAASVKQLTENGSKVYISSGVRINMLWS